MYSFREREREILEPSRLGIEWHRSSITAHRFQLTMTWVDPILASLYFFYVVSCPARPGCLHNAENSGGAIINRKE